MAQYLSYAGLSTYDEKIKQWVKDTAVEQLAALPAAEAKYEGVIVEYVGATDVYTQGYFYICEQDAETSAYSWKQINVQPKVDPTSIIDDTQATTATTYSSTKIDNQIKDNAKDATYKAESAEGAGDAITIAEAIAALENATTLNYKGIASVEPTAPADGDLYYFNIEATEEASAVKGWKFYSKTESAWKDLNDATLADRVDALETQVGKDKEVNAYTEKTDLVDIVNVLTADDTVAGSVAKVVKDAVKDLEGAMHFKAVVTPDRTGETPQTDEDAMNAWYTAEAETPAPGDVFVISDNAKEYIVSAVAESGDVSYREIGDEGLFVQKTTTIAGIDLQDDITKEELITALEIEAIPDSEILKLFGIETPDTP